MRAKVDPPPLFVVAEPAPPKCGEFGEEERREHTGAPSREITKTVRGHSKSAGSNLEIRYLRKLRYFSFD